VAARTLWAAAAVWLRSRVERATQATILELESYVFWDEFLFLNYRHQRISISPKTDG
jgi:hypothetical protein